MSPESVVGLALATVVFSLVPGPGVMAVVAQSLGRGFATGVRFSAGMILGDLVYLQAAMFGMGWIATQLGGYFVIIKWMGAAYLIWMGVGYLLSSAKPQQRESCSSGHAFLAGFCVTLGNPKAIAFYCGFLPGFVDMEQMTLTTMAEVVCIVIPVALAIPIGYAWLAAKGRNAACTGRLFRVANCTAGGVMIGTGAVVLAE